MGYRVQYGRLKGDPFLGPIGGFLGGVARTIGSFVPGPAGMVLKAAGTVLGPKPKPMPAQIGPPVLFPKQTTQIGPGGLVYKHTEYGARVTGGGPSLVSGGKRRRRMNPLNPRALRRAASRLNSFKTHVKTVSRALGQPVSWGRRSPSRSRRKCG